MNENVPGNPSCSRISQDSTSATSPIAIAVTEYWTAMTLASWEKTYLRDPAMRVVQLDVLDFGGRDPGRTKRGIDHRISSLLMGDD